MRAIGLLEMSQLRSFRLNEDSNSNSCSSEGMNGIKKMVSSVGIPSDSSSKEVSSCNV